MGTRLKSSARGGWTGLPRWGGGLPGRGGLPGWSGGLPGWSGWSPRLALKVSIKGLHHRGLKKQGCLPEWLPELSAVASRSGSRGFEIASRDFAVVSRGGGLASRGFAKSKRFCIFATPIALWNSGRQAQNLGRQFQNLGSHSGGPPQNQLQNLGRQLQSLGSTEKKKASVPGANISPFDNNLWETSLGNPGRHLQNLGRQIPSFERPAPKPWEASRTAPLTKPSGDTFGETVGGPWETPADPCDPHGFPEGSWLRGPCLRGLSCQMKRCKQALLLARKRYEQALLLTRKSNITAPPDPKQPLLAPSPVAASRPPP